MSELYDLLIKNVRVVRPYKTTVDTSDIAIKDGKFASIAPNLKAESAKEVFDGKGLLAFPGCVDAHMHIGIYQRLDRDAVSESKAAAMGGVTSSLNYMRTGQYYLNRGGAYRDFMPEVMRLSEGNFWVDYGYHIAPIDSDTSTRWSSWYSTTAFRRSRSSCSTAATACMAARTAKTIS